MTPRFRRILPWLPAALLALLCVWPIHRFELQPQDAPGTLRHLLWPVYAAFLHRYASPVDAAKGWMILCSILLAIPVLLVLLLQYFDTRGQKPRGRLPSILCSRPLFVAAVALALLACRFTLLFFWASNPDEDDFLALAHKLLTNPVVFRSVDTQTSGPLVVYPLNLAAIFGFTPDYASARLISLLLILLSLYFVLRSVRLMASEPVARASILPAVVFFAVLTHPDFRHYSSEMVPVLLVSLAVYAAAYIIRYPQSYGLPLFALGGLASAAFFAKAQCLPIVLAAAAVALLSLFVRSRRFWRPAGLYAAGILPVPLVVASALTLSGSWHDWWFSYILWNFKYVRTGDNVTADLQGLAGFLFAFVETQLLTLSLLVLLGCSLYLLFRRPKRAGLALIEILAVGGGLAALIIHFAPAPKASGIDWRIGAVCLLVLAAGMLALLLHDVFRASESAWWAALAIVLLPAALACVFAGHMLFPHYLLLLVIPVSVALGWLLSRQTGRAATLSLLVLFVALAIFEGAERIPRLRGIFLETPPATQAVEGPLIRKITPSGSSMVVWGWHAVSYLASARPMATRDPHIQPLFCCNADLVAQYRERFLRDLRATPAALFLDTLDVSCCFLNDRKTYGFDTVPEIRSYIDAHFIWVTSQFRQQFYLRRDLAAIPDPKPCDAGALLCYQPTAPARTESLPLRLPEHARLETSLTPLDAVDPAILFGTESPSSGFQFQYAGGGKYRLVAGDAASRDLNLPEGRHVSLAIEFDGVHVTLFRDGEICDRLRMPHPLQGTDLQFTAAGWKDLRFAAALDRLQIRSVSRNVRESLPAQPPAL